MTKTIRFGCCDYRTHKGDVYYFGTVGARVIPEVLDDLVHIMSGIETIQLVGHHDCKASRLRLNLPVGVKLAAADAQRVDHETQRFLGENLPILLAHPEVHKAVRHGVEVKVGLDTLNDGKIHWLDPEELPK
jgi:carbonic anhydrase